MLVLSRKEGEKLVIGDNITLVVSKISGNRVTLGIEAPADVKIIRGELSDSPKGRRPSTSGGPVCVLEMHRYTDSGIIGTAPEVCPPWREQERSGIAVMVAGLEKGLDGRVGHVAGGVSQLAQLTMAAGKLFSRYQMVC